MDSGEKLTQVTAYDPNSNLNRHPNHEFDVFVRTVVTVEVQVMIRMVSRAVHGGFDNVNKPLRQRLNSQ